MPFMQLLMPFTTMTGNDAVSHKQHLMPITTTGAAMLSIQWLQWWPQQTMVPMNHLLQIELVSADCVRLPGQDHQAMEHSRRVQVHHWRA